MGCKVFLHAVAVLWLAGSLAAEQLRFDAVDEWRTWRLPLGIVALDDVGVIRPVEIRKNVDPCAMPRLLAVGFTRLAPMRWLRRGPLTGIG